MRLIDADKLPVRSIDETDLPKDKGLLVVLKEDIDNAPTVEQEAYITGEDYNLYIKGYEQAREDFERPQGDWIDHGNNIECDQCHVWFLKDHLIRKSFCPNCGAEMKSFKDCTELHKES